MIGSSIRELGVIVVATSAIALLRLWRRLWFYNSRCQFVIAALGLRLEAYSRA